MTAWTRTIRLSLQFVFKTFLLYSCLLFMGQQLQAADTKIGILIGSYGDIDHVKTELRPFIRNTLTDPDILPLPAWLRATIADAGWYIERAKLLEHYAAIGGRTGTRLMSQKQAEAVAAELQRRGLNAKGYAGFTMTTPYVSTVMDQIRADGVDQLIVLYQGAQYSHDTTQILFRHVTDYLNKHPDWKVDVVGVRSFSDDPRFGSLIEANINRELKDSLSRFDPGDVCIYLTAHGNVKRLEQQGDPYSSQVMRVINSIRDRFSSSQVFYGFHNHDEIPVVAWSKPNDTESLNTVAAANCKAVLINGQISFTVDNLETLYNQLIEAPEILSKALAQRHLPSKEVVVSRVFNLDPDFVSLSADISEEALQGAGDILPLSGS